MIRRSPSSPPLVRERRRRADRRLPRAPRRARRCCWRACRSRPCSRRPSSATCRPTHAKRLAKAIEETAAFLDPLIVVRGEDGRLWTPNGRHRLAAAKVLGLKQITALISAGRVARLPHPRAQHREGPQPQGPQPRGDPHGAQPRQAARPRARGASSPREFEAAELLDARHRLRAQSPRFAGGAYSAFLKKVDRFSERTLAASLRQREDYAARLLEIDTRVKAADRRAAGPRLQVPVPAQLRGRAHQPGALPQGQEGRHAAADAARRRRSRAWRRRRATSTWARCRTPISPGWRSAPRPTRAAPQRARPRGGAAAPASSGSARR